METGSGRAVEVAPFHSRGALKGFVVSGRWPNSTKEWAQLLMVAVRVASLPDCSPPQRFSAFEKNSRTSRSREPWAWSSPRALWSANPRWHQGISPIASRQHC